MELMLTSRLVAAADSSMADSVAGTSGAFCQKQRDPIGPPESGKA